MTANSLVRQTALVLVEKLPDDYDLEYDPLRIKTAELWQCFYVNQCLKVVQQPATTYCVYPYTIVDNAGWCLPKSETYSLDRAIAYCNLCIVNIPEFNNQYFIPNAIDANRKKEIENAIRHIKQILDEEFPKPEELEVVS